MSETGAMLEGAALPLVGESLTLRRLGLEIGAKVVWSTNARCGVRFEGSISVAGWRTGTWIAPIGTNNQARVDEIQAAARAGRLANPTVNAGNSAPATNENTDTNIARELMALQRMLDDMGDQLTDNSTVVALFGVTLQKFDIASQILGHLAGILSSGDRSSAISAVGMEELRIRLCKTELETFSEGQVGSL